MSDVRNVFAACSQGSPLCLLCNTPGAAGIRHEHASTAWCHRPRPTAAPHSKTNLPKFEKIVKHTYLTE